MDKEFILAEIKRTAEQNGGVPLGRAKFAKATGINGTDWYGMHWSRWGDAVAEAGYQPNELQLPFDERRLLEALALLTRELGRFPVAGELRIKARQDKTFPSHTVFVRLGSKAERVRRVLDYCAQAHGFDDFAAICRTTVAEGQKEVPREAGPGTETQIGFVYLARMGKYYKIGHTGSLGRREYELSLQLPEKLTLRSARMIPPELRRIGTSASSVSAPTGNGSSFRPKRCEPSSGGHSCDRNHASLAEADPALQSRSMNSSTVRPAWLIMLRKVPRGRSLPVCTGTVVWRVGSLSWTRRQ